ncbi:hypothetical protein ACOZ38_19990 [Sphaerisporangium viridialbum]|uniref:hypothetical protein n=1 Tax=Sphaerisporangium viridialbum TaxID=46189 RepID=UPI003C76147B
MDVLTLTRHLRAQLDAAELAMISVCRQDKEGRYSWSRIAAALGLRTPQAGEQYAKRLQAASRRLPRRPEALRQESHGRRRTVTWAAGHGRRVIEVARSLVVERDGLARTRDAEDWLDGIEELLAASEPGAAQWGSLLAHFRLLAAALDMEFGDTPMAPGDEVLQQALRLASEHDAATRRPTV